MPSNSPLRLVVFDCDGTLVDSQRTIVAAMAKAFESENLLPPGAGAVRRVIGLSLHDAVAHLAPGHGSDRYERLVATYRSTHPQALADHAGSEAVYPGARDSLQALARAGYVLGVATGKGRRGLVATLERHRLDGFFATLQTADFNAGKPHPEMLCRAMDETGIGPHETVFVGDSVYDMEMAVNAGVAGIGVSWGYHPPADLRRAGAGGIAKTFTGLPGLVQQTMDSTA